MLQEAARAEDNKEPAALCTVVRSEGSTPRHVGSKMLVFADGRFTGTVGGGELENRVLAEAKAALAEGKARLLSYSLAEPSRGDPGVCGGQVEVFVEPLLPPAMVVVVGCGHVGKAVAHLAKWLGFRVAATDDRPELCNKDAVPDADTLLVCKMAELPSRMKIDRRTYLVLSTRGSSIDVEGLPPLLETDAAYIGIIGSQRRWKTTLKELASKGVPADKMGQVHSPIGLELQAETPEEIAVSIMAEILMLRDKGTGEAMKVKDQPAESRRP
jgi:xanthine dehydrogenase accessory factor